MSDNDERPESFRPAPGRRDEMAARYPGPDRTAPDTKEQVDRDINKRHDAKDGS